MENVEALMGALFNAALVIFIMAAMFAASYLGKGQPAPEEASVATTEAR